MLVRRGWDVAVVGCVSWEKSKLKVLWTAYCVLRTENIFVCYCCVGSDRVAGGGVSRVRPSVQCAMTGGHACGDGRPCSRLPRSDSHTTRCPVCDL